MKPYATATRATNRRDARAGFLLVEALATMVISAFLLVALVSTAGLMLRAGERSTAVADESETTARVFAALERDIGMAARVDWGGSGPNAGMVFSGTADKLVFARDVATSDGVGETLVFTYQVEPAQDGTGNRLLLATAPMTPFTTGIANLDFGAPATVYTGSETFRFSYFDRLAGGEEVVTDDWPSQTRMPVAVRAAMIDPATGAVEASVRIPLVIDAEPGCAFPEEAPCSYVARAPAGGNDDDGANVPPDQASAPAATSDEASLYGR